jgi:putative transposase
MAKMELDCLGNYFIIKFDKQDLSRKEHGSSNWETQRRRVAEAHKRMRNKKLDFKHKLGAFHTQEYDAVFVEDLNVKSILESDRNNRNTHEVGWREFVTIIHYHGKTRGCNVVEVAPDGTTKECASCGVSTDKPLWVRKHSFPACGFETDCDYNAALNVWERGTGKL